MVVIRGVVQEAAYSFHGAPFEDPPLESPSLSISYKTRNVIERKKK